jgi:hypothetical protein
MVSNPQNGTAGDAGMQVILAADGSGNPRYGYTDQNNTFPGRYTVMNVNLDTDGMGHVNSAAEGS